MTPDCRAWTERMIAQWAARVALLQDDPAATSGQLMRAACLDDVVRDLQGRLAAAGPVVVLSAVDAQRARWEADLAAIQPYRHPDYGVMFNEGPIMDAVRWRIEDRLGMPRSAATGKPVVRPRWHDAPMTAPTEDPAPFVAREQMSMFA